jgi:hypothetical protein
MIRKTKYTLILLITFAFTTISAQNSQVMYFMNLPQNHLLNPAMRPSNSLYIGLPGISGINLNVNNNFVNFSDVFMKGQTGDSVISILHPSYNINSFLAKINDKNSIEPETSVQLFGLGFSAGKDLYLFLDINERIDGNVVIPGDLFKLALMGNEGFVGNKIDLSSLRGDLKWYREVGFGFSKNFTNKLRIGVKAKVLFGIADVSIDNKSLGIAVNNDYSHTLNADITANISGPLVVTKDSKNDVNNFKFDDSSLKTVSQEVGFISGSKNMGLGLDVGATYDVTSNFVVSAAITDLGFIRWKNEVTNLRAKGQFEFSGLNMLDVINGTKTLDQLGNELADSLKNAFKVSDSKSAFTTYLPFGITLGGNYSVTKFLSFGLLSYSRVIEKQLRQSVTLSTNVNLGNAFSTSLTYTAANHRFDNIGAGLAFRPGIFQFYIVTDRIPLVWNKIINDKSTIPVPSSWNTVNLRVGMNLAFGNRVRKKDDKPMVEVE